MPGLRIGVNALYLIPGGVGGTEIYLRSLLCALSEIDSQNEYVIFVNRETGASLVTERPGFRHFQCGVNASNRPARILYEQFVLPWKLRESGIDVLFNPGFTMPIFAGCPSVTVFHDLQHKRHPEFFRRLDLVFWNVLLGLSTRRSRSLIAVSPATARDLESYLPQSRGKIRVVPHGVDPEMFRIGRHRRRLPDGRGSERDLLPSRDRDGAVYDDCENAPARRQDARKFILTVSTLHPHKNFHRLLDAFAEFHSTRPEYRLVVAGMKGFAAEEVITHCRARGLQSCVEFTGWIPREDLYQLWERADAFIYPSLFEGFGMPVAESLAAGLPSACSDIDPLRWVGGEAVALFDPTDVSAIRAAMERITGDPLFRAAAPGAGPAQANQFDWRHSAEATLEELERAAK